MRQDTHTDLYKYISPLDTVEDCREVRTMAKERMDRLAMAMKYNLKPDMKVKITGSNKLERGTIIKVNRTRAVVDVDGIQWTVPFSMITEEIKDERKK